MNNTQFAMLVGAGLAVLWYVAGKAGATAAGVVEEVTPASRENFIYDNIIGGAGDVLNDGERNGNFSLGSAIYDFFHPNEFEELLGGNG